MEIVMKRSLLFFCIWYLFFTGCSMQNTSLQKKEISQEAAVYQNENKEKQEITLAFWYEDSQMQAVVDAFNAQSPDYQVNYVTDSRLDGMKLTPILFSESS